MAAPLPPRLSARGVLASPASSSSSVLDLEVALFWAWTSSVAGQGLQLAALAQTLMIVGAELGMVGFLAVTVEGR